VKNLGFQEVRRGPGRPKKKKSSNMETQTEPQSSESGNGRKNSDQEEEGEGVGMGPMGRPNRNTKRRNSGSDYGNVSGNNIKNKKLSLSPGSSSSAADTPRGQKRERKKRERIVVPPHVSVIGKLSILHNFLYSSTRDKNNYRHVDIQILFS
jgi:hypothetical protein